MISKIKYLLVAYLLFSCHPQQKLNFSNNEPEADILNEEFFQGDGNIAIHYKTKDFDVAIFPKESEAFFTKQERFTPEKSDIDKAEKALRSGLKNINRARSNQSSSPIIDENLNKYKRQYFGFIDENGDKYLLINSFWGEDDNDYNWLNKIVIVEDGGSYYWSVKYYLEEDELRDLSVNGYA